MTPVSTEAVDWAGIDTCVLDMDGTLLDLHFDDQVWNECLPRRYAERAGLPPDAARDHVRAALMAEHGTLTWYCLEHWSRVFRLELTSIEDELQHLIRVRPGVNEFLAFLGRRRCRTVLATNAHPRSLSRKLDITGIRVHFERVVSAHHYGCAKEHDGFWPALAAQCDIAPARTLFIDDNHAVLTAARRFGIRYLFAIAQPNSRGQRVAAGEFHALETFTELTAGVSGE